MTKKLFIGFLFLNFLLKAQVNEQALENFNKAIFQKLEKKDHSDVTIIFDKTYIDINQKKFTEVYTTVHRKIKIHSLFGLEQYNKLYIPTINDLNIKLDFIQCKAKTLKKDNTSIVTSKEHMVSTTLPANAPFFYKVNGDVKMLAIKDVNIGDEIEYIYTTKQTYDTVFYFYKTDKIDFGTIDYCLEKSLFIKAKNLNVNIWPYNFHNGLNRKSDFSFEKGYKVNLKDIEPNFQEIYSQSNLNVPYLVYEIKSTINRESKDTWEDFAKNFKPRRQDTRKNYILNGESITKTLEEVDTILTNKKKYETLLSKINKPIEDNFYIYEDIKEDIGTAFSYAKTLSKAAKKLNLPINFHFLVSKNNGQLDKSLVSLYQFDTIICSFKTEEGTMAYFPLVAPYSVINDIKKEYQETECFSIKQDSNGKRTHAFDFIPLLKKGSFQKKVHLNFSKIKQDTLKITANESLKFSGHSWLQIKPSVSHLIKDTLRIKKRLKSFVKTQIVLTNEIDSIYNLNYAKKEDSFVIDYQYDIQKKVNPNSAYINISPRHFFEKDFFTPHYQKTKRTHKGYLTNEFNTSYFFSFDGINSWLKNRFLKIATTNEIGSVNSNYKYNNDKLETSIKLNFEKGVFEASDWSKVLDLRESMYNFLNSKFYFKI